MQFLVGAITMGNKRFIIKHCARLY